MNETKRSREEVIAAIKGSAGIISTIANRLEVSRPTVYSYLDRWATARDALAAEEETPLDLSESVVIANIRAAAKQQRDSKYTAIVDSSDAKWYLSRKGKGRGYVERQEMTGKEGAPLHLTWGEAENT